MGRTTMIKPGNTFRVVAIVGLLLAATDASAAAPRCNRSCLIASLDRYLAATVAHSTAGLGFAPGFRETQNAADTIAGRGIWITAKALGSGVRYADPETGEAGYFGIVEEEAGPAIVGLRIKLQPEGISEAEWIIARNGMTFYKPEGFVANLPRAARPAGVAAENRAAALAIANSYFEGIDESSGPLVKEHPECYRIENGTHIVGRKPDEPPHTASRPAGDGFRTGATNAGINSCTNGFADIGKRTEDVIDRRFFYDSEAGVVWSHGTFKRVPGAMLSGAPAAWLNFMELFQIDNGRIRGIYAAMDFLPPEITKSGWGGADE
jgi:hypothetical protein